MSHSEIAADPLDGGDVPRVLSLADLLKRAYAGGDLLPLYYELCERLRLRPDDASILMDLSLVQQILGDQPGGLARQAAALARQGVYRSSRAAPADALRVLALMAPGDIGTNTPIDFLLQGANTVLYAVYMRDGAPMPASLPPHDVAIVTMGESGATRAALMALETAVAGWPCRVLNRPARVLDLSRDRLQPVLDGAPGVVMPATVRVPRHALAQLSNGAIELPDLLADAVFPMIARPVDSHAGRGLAKLDGAGCIAPYLAAHADDTFYISRYVDYRSADGLFRKYRIVWIDSVPFAVHLAICTEWKVWYLNADMEANAAKRAEEAQFMAAFETGFACRHAGALRAVIERLGLDYVGIDCAETPDGRLLIFEGDISLIVHDMDPPDLFAYKQPAMRKLFSAFQAMLYRRAEVRSEELLQA